MTGTQVWLATPNTPDGRAAVRYSRVAVGAHEALQMLRDAEQEARSRITSPDWSKQLLILVEQPAKLFNDETHGLLVQARTQSLSRVATHRNGVRLEVQW